MNNISEQESNYEPLNKQEYLDTLYTAKPKDCVDALCEYFADLPIQQELIRLYAGIMPIVLYNTWSSHALDNDPMPKGFKTYFVLKTSDTNYPKSLLLRSEYSGPIINSWNKLHKLLIPQESAERKQQAEMMLNSYTGRQVLIPLAINTFLSQKSIETFGKLDRKLDLESKKDQPKGHVITDIAYFNTLETIITRALHCLDTNINIGLFARPHSAAKIIKNAFRVEIDPDEIILPNLSETSIFEKVKRILTG